MEQDARSHAEVEAKKRGEALLAAQSQIQERLVFLCCVVYGAHVSARLFRYVSAFLSPHLSLLPHGPVPPDMFVVKLLRVCVFCE